MIEFIKILTIIFGIAVALFAAYHSISCGSFLGLSGCMIR